MKKATKKSIMAKVNKEFRLEVFRCIFICYLFLVVAMLMTNLSTVCIKYTYLSIECRNAESEGKKMKWVGYNQQRNWLESDSKYYDYIDGKRDNFIASNALAHFFSENFSDTLLLKAFRLFLFIFIWVITIIVYFITYKLFKRTIRHLAFELVKKVRLERRLSLQ